MAVCCIYHRPRALDESSDESSESSSDDSDSDDDRDMQARRAGQHRRRHQGDCEHGDDGNDEASCPGHSHDIKRAAKKKPIPNAYERVPKQKRPQT
jgi:protein phosphatase 1 regulatory subunit 11